MGTSPLTSFLETIEMRLVRPPRSALRVDLGPMGGLVASIEDKGLLEPIVVRPTDEGFELVAGSRRFEACKKLGWRSVPCHIVELNYREAFEVALLENAQRETLNPIEEARAFRKYVDEYGYGGESDLARKTGKSQEYVSRRIHLLDLPFKVQEQIMRRRIAPSVAQELTLLSDEGAVAMAETIRLQRLSLREVRRIIKNGACHGASNMQLLSVFDESGGAGSERKVQKVVRELNKAIALLRTDFIRLGEVAESVEDEWLVRESILVCRDNLRGQIENLARLKRKLERAQESNPNHLALIR